MVIWGGSIGEFCGFADCAMLDGFVSHGKMGSLRIRLTVGDLVFNFEVAILMGRGRYCTKRKKEA